MIINYDTGEKKTVVERVKNNSKEFVTKQALPLGKKGYKIFLSSRTRLSNTKFVQQFAEVFRSISDLLMKIAWMRIVIFNVRDGAHLWKKFYGEFLFIFAFTFVSLPFLLFLLESSPQLFFLVLLPTILINSLALSALYYYIDKNEKGEKISLFKSILYCLSQLFSITTFVFFYTFIVIEFILLLVAFGFLLSLLFSALHVDWLSSLSYWAILLIVGTISSAALFILTIIAHQTYYSFLLDRKNPFQASSNSFHGFKVYFGEGFPLFLILLLTFVPLAMWFSISYFDVGLGVTLLLFTHTTVLLSYLLRKKLLSRTSVPSESASEKHTLSQNIFIALFGLGVMGYIIFTNIAIVFYPTIIQTVHNLQQDRTILQTLTTYQNQEYGYIIEHPQSWDIYEWQTNSTTFFNNYTETFIGGIWVNITVFPFSETKFETLFANKNGTVFKNKETDETTTKSNNIVVQSYRGVQYTNVKPDFPFSEYQTHYLIRKGNLLYDLSFTTRSKEIEEYNGILFERMFRSFRFIE